MRKEKRRSKVGQESKVKGQWSNIWRKRGDVPTPNKTDKKEKKNARETLLKDNLPLFKATFRLRVTGLNQTRLLNVLNKEVTLKNIKRVSPKILEFTISKKESEKAFTTLQKMCYTYDIMGRGGVRTVFASCLRHVGLLIGALVFGAAIALASQTVWKIDISGNSLVDDLTITRSLKECGVKVGSFKNKVDTDVAAAALREVKGVAEASAELKGTTVYIRLLEEKNYIPQGEKGAPRDITSKYDAEITRMSVVSGTAQVKLGDRVAAGGVLIKAERLSSIGESMGYTPAEGSIYGRVAFKETHIFSKTEQILCRTGEKKIYTNLSIFGLDIGKKPDKSGESVTTEEKLFFIPIKVTRTEVYATEVISRERDMDEYVARLKAEAVLKNVIRAGGSEIETATTLTVLEGGMYMVCVYVVAEVLIS
ncbi:MAG: sporulation protein YqfD [Firmicutes bacterium]|nr:sporulation protein YqfD [Bacillota bacterium]